jgi:hypothetical protein
MRNQFFAYISNCKLTLVTKCTHERKIAPEFSLIIDFFKNVFPISGLLKFRRLAISGLANSRLIKC